MHHHGHTHATRHWYPQSQAKVRVMYCPQLSVAKEHLSKFNYYFIVLNLFWTALYFHCYVVQSLTKQTRLNGWHLFSLQAPGFA